MIRKADGVSEAVHKAGYAGSPRRPKPSAERKGPALPQKPRKADLLGSLTVDVEEWFHMLDTPATPEMMKWESLECRVDQNVERLLETLDRHSTRATFFWLAWVAERHARLVRRCVECGHEVACHGFGHVLAYQVGPEAFREDIARGKMVLEDITGRPIRGFRAPGFGITEHTDWAFEVIREAGYEYDASVFPTVRGHGGMPGFRTEPHLVHTNAGPLVELPMSVVEALGRRVCLFSGGYLRIAPICLIRWGIRSLCKANKPLIVLVHPREIDPYHPRLPLSLKRRFKSYVGLRSMMPKLRWLCAHYNFRPMRELADQVLALEDVGG